MASEDWADRTRTDEWSVEMVDPANPAITRGELRNVTALSLTCGYYSDTRMSASVQTFGDDGYVANSQLRIWHSVPEWGYRRPVFTGYVSSAPQTSARGKTRTTYNLNSALFAMQRDLWTTSFAIGKGGKALSAMKSILSGSNRKYSVLAGAGDYLFSASKAWEAASSKLTTLFELADLAGNRLSVDREGYVTIGRYAAPSRLKTPDWTLDTDDDRAMTTSDEISRDSTELDVPGRYIVTHKNGDEVTIGVANVSAGAPSSPGVRGYVVAETLDVSDLPGGAAQARSLATQYLSAAQGGQVEWGLSTLYFPAREGDAVLLRLWGEERFGFIKDIDADLLAGTMKVTVKEAGQ